MRPVCGSESTKRCVLTLTHVEKDQTSTVRPALEDHKEEHEIDLGVPGLLHAVVKDSEHLRVKAREEDRESSSSRADLQHNNVHNPFSHDSKAMIREMGNVELFELCETIPRVQCPECLLFGVIE